MKFAAFFLATITFALIILYVMPLRAGSLIIQLTISKKAPECLAVESRGSNGQFKKLNGQNLLLTIINNCNGNVSLTKIDAFPALKGTETIFPPFEIYQRNEKNEHISFQYAPSSSECTHSLINHSNKAMTCSTIIIAPKEELSIAIGWGRFYSLTGRMSDQDIKIETTYVHVYGDFEKSIDFFVVKAKEGSSLAQRILGQAYLHIEKIRSRQKAEEWLLLAAENGDADAQAMLGMSNAGYYQYTGDPAPKTNFEEAAKWLQKAIDQNADYATCALGSLYAEGHGVKKDYSHALKLWAGKDRSRIDTLRREADAGDIAAQIELGDIYFYTKCRDKDEDGIESESRRWYLQAAEAGSADAQLRIAMKYRDYADDVARFEMMQHVRESKDGNKISKFPDKKYPPEMLQWLQKSVDQNYPPAQDVLAGLYRFGIAVGKDTDQALLLYKKSAEQGYYVAQDVLAELALEKHPPDYEEAYFQASLAARTPCSITDIEAIKKNLTAAQIAKIEKRAEAWKPTPVYIPQDSKKK